MYVLIFGALVAYVIVIICGTMGSPEAIKVNKVDCGPQNNCTLDVNNQTEILSLNN